MKCPNCSHYSPLFTASNGDFRNPRDGDATICIECLSFSIFENKLTVLRPLTEADILMYKMEGKWHGFLKVQEAKRQVKQIEFKMKKISTMEIAITKTTDMLFYKIGEIYTVEKHWEKWGCYKVFNQQELTLIAKNHCMVLPFQSNKVNE